MQEFDLRFWDNVEFLTTLELISLAVGYHPEMDPGWLGYDNECRRKHIMKLMQEAHNSAAAWSEEIIERATTLGFTDKLAQHLGKLHNPPADGKLPPDFQVWANQLKAPCGRNGLLFTTELQEHFERAAIRDVATQRKGKLASLMLAVGQLGQPREMFKFRRGHVVDWLNHVGWRSEYFGTPSGANCVEAMPPSDYAGSNSTTRWPWGKHETELLRVMEKAALKWWVNYDPSDPTTAPTNDDVANWIVENKLAARYMAGAIATILRAEGLPSGPRKG